MSESNDAPPPPANPPDEPPAGSPFPESSLTPPPLPPQEPEAPAAGPPSFGVPTPAPPEPPPSWMATPAPAPPATPAPSGGGLLSGDPLGGSAPSSGDPLAGAPLAPPASTFPSGYTSPPPPGAGGGFSAPPAATAFGAGGPAAGTYVLAGWWRRVGAAVIDGIIISIVAFVIMAPLGIGAFATGEDAGGGSVIALVLGFLAATLVFAVVALAYAPVMMGKTNGKTLGRMATGIRVVRADGQTMTIGFAALREVAVKFLLINAIAGSFTFFLASLLDVLWPLWDDENRALHDFVVNTRTVMD